MRRWIGVCDKEPSFTQDLLISRDVIVAAITAKFYVNLWILKATFVEGLCCGNLWMVEMFRQRRKPKLEQQITTTLLSFRSGGSFPLLHEWMSGNYKQITEISVAPIKIVSISSSKISQSVYRMHLLTTDNCYGLSLSNQNFKLVSFQGKF